MTLHDDVMSVAEADAIIAQYRPRLFRVDPGGPLTREAHDALMEVRTRPITDRAPEAPARIETAVRILPVPKRAEAEPAIVMPPKRVPTATDCGKSPSSHRRNGTPLCDGCRAHRNAQKAASARRARARRKGDGT